MSRNAFFPLALGCLFLIATGAGCAISDRQIIDQADQTHSTLAPAIIRAQALAQYFQVSGERIIAVAREADQPKIGPAMNFDKSQDDK